MGIPGHVPRPFEHHVLKQMGEARPPGQLVRRPHVVPQIHRHHGQAVVLRKNHLQAVRQFVFLEFQLWHFQRRTLGSSLLGLRLWLRLLRTLRGRLWRSWFLCGGCHRKDQKSRYSQRQNIRIELPHHRFPFEMAQIDCQTPDHARRCPK